MKKRRIAGSITFFYACICLIFISLFGSIMESVRLHTTKSMMSDSGYLALQNSLAGYQRELWDDYHLLFLDTEEIGSTEGLTEEIQENLEMSWNTDGLLSGGDWMGVSCIAGDVVAFRYMTEEGGKELKEQVLSYMKYRAVTGVVEQLLEYFDLMQGLKQGKSFLEKKLDLEKNVAKLEEQKNQMIGKIKEMEGWWNQAEEALTSIQEKQEEWKKQQEEIRRAELERLKELEELELRRWEEGKGELEGKEKGRKEAEVKEAEKVEIEKPDILAELDILYRIAGNLSGQNQELLRTCSSYQLCYQKTEAQKGEYESWLTEQKETLEPRSWEALKEEFQELETCQQGDREYVDSLQGNLWKNETVLQRIQELCRTGIEASENISVEALEGLIKRYQNLTLPEHYQLPTGGDSRKSPFTALKEYASKGVLALVLPKGSEVSECILKAAAWQEQEEIETERKLEPLLLEYGREHFGCYTTPMEETALQYEQEYLLIGSSKDRENLTGVVSELLAVRTMADFLQILTKADKVAQARQIAITVAGVTGSSALIPVIKTGILLLWSVQDAVAEVKDLMAGKKVTLYETIGSAALDYQGYLLLLMLAGQSQWNLRAARLIEGTIQKRYKSSFQASDCAAAIKMTLTAQMKPHFIKSSFWQYTEQYEWGY